MYVGGRGVGSSVARLSSVPVESSEVKIVRVQNRAVRRREHQLIGNIILAFEKDLQKTPVADLHKRASKFSRHIHTPAFLALRRRMLAPDIVVLDDDEAIRIVLVFSELDVPPRTAVSLRCHFFAISWTV
jgi:hypothetical protein